MPADRTKKSGRDDPVFVVYAKALVLEVHNKTFFLAIFLSVVATNIVNKCSDRSSEIKRL